VGETVRAVVVPAEGAAPDESALIAFTRDRLAHYTCPISVSMVSAVPRNPHRSRGGLSTKIRPQASARFQLAGNGVGRLPGSTGPRLCAIVRDRRHGAAHARLSRDTRRQ